MIVKIKKLHEKAKMPQKANLTDAGFDLPACHEGIIEILPHQMIIAPIPDIEMVEVSELSNTDRGADGFGSSGTL